jgi:hypothetical protein
MKKEISSTIIKMKDFKIYKSWKVKLPICVIIGMMIYGDFPNISNTVLDQTGVIRILTVFVIANSLFSLILPITIKRESLRSKRKNLFVSLACLWISVFLILIEIIRGEPYYFMSTPDFLNPLTKVSIIPWTFGVYYLLKTTYSTLTIDNIQFQKKEFSFKHTNSKQWGIESINKQLLKSKKDFHFPIIVLADETTRPWKILLRFILSGLSNSYNKSIPGAIYFTFTRPASEIKEMLEDEFKRMKEVDPNCEKILGGNCNMDNIIFIDCYSLNEERELWNGKLKESNLLYANSYDPHDINSKYEIALNRLHDRKCDNIRVTYDAISDFLTFTDFEIATQYLRHNMGFEQRRKIKSLYLLRSGTMEKEKEQYFLWFANGILQMKAVSEHEKELIDVEFTGPFREPKKFKLNYDYELLDSETFGKTK